MWAIGWIDVGYYWAGAKAYDLIARWVTREGPGPLQASYYLTRERALAAFPMLQPSGLKGAIVYYDGIIPPHI